MPFNLYRINLSILQNIVDNIVSIVRHIADFGISLWENVDHLTQRNAQSYTSNLLLSSLSISVEHYFTPTYLYYESGGLYI